MTAQRVLLGLVALLVVASLVLDSLVVGAAGHAIDPGLFEHQPPLPPGVDLFAG